MGYFHFRKEACGDGSDHARLAEPPHGAMSGHLIDDDGTLFGMGHFA